MPALLLRRRRLSNNAIYLGRLQMTSFRRIEFLRPGDGERSKEVSTLMGASRG
jgi:hypothetical protein